MSAQGTPAVEVNDEVLASGHVGRFVVMKLEGTSAEIQLFGDDTRTGDRIYWEQTVHVPLACLSVIRKNHKKPMTYRVVR